MPMGNSNAQKRGALIVFEGIDRCGKTTQNEFLYKYLSSRNIPVLRWGFPDRSTSVGKTINQYLENKSDLDDTAIHLLFAANRFEKRQAILDALRSGSTVVLDRYSYSGVAYTAAKGVPHMDREWCRGVEVNLPRPDLVLYMRISAEASASRGGFGLERYEKLDFQKKVVSQFDELAALDESTGIWRVIDADRTPEVIRDEVSAAVDPVIERCLAGEQPLGRLWDGQPIPL